MTPALWVALAVAILALSGSTIAAILAARSARSARSANRVEQLEDTIEQLHTDRHMLWFYCRELVDHIYRGNPPPPPAPPEGLFK